MKLKFFLTVAIALTFALNLTMVNNSEAGCCGPGWGCHRGYYGYRYMPPPPPPPAYYGYPRFHRHYHRPYYGGYYRYYR